MNRDITAKVIIASISIIIGGFAGYVLFGGSGEGTKSGSEAGMEEKIIWTCSMHPQIRRDEPGQCPICGMDLIPLEDASTTDIATFSMSEEAAALANIQVREAEFSLPEKEIILQGKVNVDETRLALVTSRFAGRIEKLFINHTGQRVRRGQRLASIYSPELIAAQRELIEAISLKDISPELYKAARTKMKLWGLTDRQIDDIEQKGEPMETVDIISPQSGIVLKRKATLGEYIKEGTVMFEVADLSRVWVEFDAYESDIPWLNVGDLLKFSVSSVPGKLFEEKITFIDPVIDPNTRTAKVRVEVANPNNKLKPSMYATARIDARLPIDEAELIIPRSAVLWTGKRSIVYVYKDEKGSPSFEYREVVLGADLGTGYVVEEGIEAGEEVVVNGTFKVDAAAQLAGRKSMMNKPVVGGVEAQGDMEMDHSMHFHTELQVSGECGMCKDRIEKVAGKFEDVIMSDWNEETQILTIHHEHKDLDLKSIAKAVADAGHSNELFKAPASAYKSLPKCCRYTSYE